MSWIKALIAVALLAAAVFGVAQLRAQWVGAGEARVQARWDQATAQTAALAASAAQAQSRDDLARFRNSERIANEQDRLELGRSAHLAAARAESERLRLALAELDAAASAVPQAGDPGAAALAREAAAARELLGSCQARYLAVAAGAEELRDQVTGLQADAAMCRSASFR